MTDSEEAKDWSPGYSEEGALTQEVGGKGRNTVITAKPDQHETQDPFSHQFDEQQTEVLHETVETENSSYSVHTGEIDHGGDNVESSELGSSHEADPEEQPSSDGESETLQTDELKVEQLEETKAETHQEFETNEEGYETFRIEQSRDIDSVPKYEIAEETEQMDLETNMLSSGAFPGETRPDGLPLENEENLQLLDEKSKISPTASTNEFHSNLQTVGCLSSEEQFSPEPSPILPSVSYIADVSLSSSPNSPRRDVEQVASSPTEPNTCEVDFITDTPTVISLNSSPPQNTTEGIIREDEERAQDHGVTLNETEVTPTTLECTEKASLEAEMDVSIPDSVEAATNWKECSLRKEEEEGNLVRLEAVSEFSEDSMQEPIYISYENDSNEFRFSSEIQCKPQAQAVREVVPDSMETVEEFQHEFDYANVTEEYQGRPALAEQKFFELHGTESMVSVTMDERVNAEVQNAGRIIQNPEFDETLLRTSCDNLDNTGLTDAQPDYEEEQLQLANGQGLNVEDTTFDSTSEKREDFEGQASSDVESKPEVAFNDQGFRPTELDMLQEDANKKTTLDDIQATVSECDLETSRDQATEDMFSLTDIRRDTIPKFSEEYCDKTTEQLEFSEPHTFEEKQESAGSNIILETASTFESTLTEFDQEVRPTELDKLEEDANKETTFDDIQAKVSESDVETPRDQAIEDMLSLTDTHQDTIAKLSEEYCDKTTDQLELSEPHTFEEKQGSAGSVIILEPESTFESTLTELDQEVRQTELDMPRENANTETSFDDLQAKVSETDFETRPDQATADMFSLTDIRQDTIPELSEQYCDQTTEQLEFSNLPSFEEKQESACSYMSLEKAGSEEQFEPYSTDHFQPSTSTSIQQAESSKEDFANEVFTEDITETVEELKMGPQPEKPYESFIQESNLSPEEASELAVSSALVEHVGKPSGQNTPSICSIELDEHSQNSQLGVENSQRFAHEETIFMKDELTTMPPKNGSSIQPDIQDESILVQTVPEVDTDNIPEPVLEPQIGTICETFLPQNYYPYEDQLDFTTPVIEEHAGNATETHYPANDQKIKASYIHSEMELSKQHILQPTNIDNLGLYSVDQRHPGDDLDLRENINGYTSDLEKVAHKENISKGHYSRATDREPLIDSKQRSRTLDSRVMNGWLTSRTDSKRRAATLGRSLSRKRSRLQPKPAPNDDHLFPDSVTPSKVERGLSKRSLADGLPEGTYDVPYIDDDAFLPKQLRDSYHQNGSVEEDSECSSDWAGWYWQPPNYYQSQLDPSHIADTNECIPTPKLGHQTKSSPTAEEDRKLIVDKTREKRGRKKLPFRLCSCVGRQRKN